MFEVNVDEEHAIVNFVLEGVVPADEMERFVRTLKQATLDLKGAKSRSRPTYEVSGTHRRRSPT